MPKKRTTDSADWTSLKSGMSKKSSRRKPISWRALGRRVWVWTKRVCAVAALVGIVWGGIELYRNSYFDDFFGGESKPISRLEFKTDGAITGAWLNGYLKIRRGTKLADVNIFAIKQSLDAMSQIKSSKVERLYPDVLRITISERAPIAKVSQKVDFQTRVFLMDSDGAFFSPVCISDDKIKSLKTVAGIATKFAGNAPAPYGLAQKLEEFLNATKARVPEIYGSWVSVDVSQLGSRTLPLITATAADGAKYVFKPSEYPRQLDRLEYIMKYMRENPTNKAEKIDLTLEEWSVVKFETPKSK